MRAAAAADVADESANELRVNINAHDLAAPVSQAVLEHIRERVDHAVRHFPQAVRFVDVKLSSRDNKKNKGRPDQKAEVMLHLEKAMGGLVRSERHNYDSNLYAAIDGACIAVERKLRKLKERKSDKSIEHGRRLVVSEVIDTTELVDSDTLPFYAEASSDVTLPAEVVRKKFFEMGEGMTLEKATEQMVDLGHDFFVFKNEETGELNVAYKRKRGGYGVIIPTM